MTSSEKGLLYKRILEAYTNYHRDDVTETPFGDIDEDGFVEYEGTALENISKVLDEALADYPLQEFLGADGKVHSISLPSPHASFEWLKKRFGYPKEESRK